MAMQTPNTQILPIAPTYSDLGALTKWAQDLTRTLQQNLGGIARKANEAVPAISPLTANLNAAGFNITGIGNLTAATAAFSGLVTGTTFTITADYIASTPAAATRHNVMLNNSVGASSFSDGAGGNTAIIFDDTHGFFIQKETKANILNLSFAAVATVWSIAATGAVTMTGALLGATTGTFSGAVSMAGLTATTGTFSGALSGITTLAASGTVTLSAVAALSLTGSGSNIEQGASASANSPYHDWHSSASATDFDFRMMASGGTAAAGAGTMTFTGATLALGATNLTANTATITTVTGTTINATGNLQQNGVAIPFQNSFESAQQTIASAGALTLAHGLGVKPKLYMAVLQCTTADLGYSIGDEVLIAPNPSVSNVSFAIWPDTTNINIRFGSGATPLAVTHKTTGVGTLITAASWRLVARAWA